MYKFPRLVRLAFVLITVATAVLLYVFLLHPDFLAVDRRFRIQPSQLMPAKGKENKEVTSWWSPRGVNGRREEFAKIAAFDAHLLTKGFTDEQVR